MEELITAIQQSSDISLPVITEMVKLFKPVSYPPGTILASPGSILPQGAYFQSGLVKYYLKGKEDEEIIINFRYAPTFLTYSLVGFYMNKPSEIYCETITATKFLVIDSSDLLALADKHPRIYNFLLPEATRVHYRRYLKQFGIIEKTSKERYLDYLKEYREVVDLIPQKDVAAYLNIHPGSLSRIRKGLKNR